MDTLKIVNLYIETDLHGPRRADGVAMYLLETQIRGGTYTKDNKETIIDIPDTTEHHLVLTALKTSLKRITKSCQVEIYLQDRYIAAAIDGGLLQRWMMVDRRIVARTEQIKKIAGGHEFAIGIPDKLTRRHLAEQYYLGKKGRS